MSEWSPKPLADAILSDRAAPPLLLLAAWLTVYRNDSTELTRLARLAASGLAGDDTT